MKCKICSGTLEILKRCGSLQMRCSHCGKLFAIHEVVDQLDPQTEELLERYNAIIYD